MQVSFYCPQPQVSDKFNLRAIFVNTMERVPQFRPNPEAYAPTDMLMMSVKQGSRTAFEKLFAATSSKVCGILVQMLRNRSDADEVMQEVYIQVWTKSHLYTPGLSHAKCWINHIARNAAIDHIRHKGRQPHGVEYVDTQESELPGPEDLAMLSSDWRRLSVCLSKLQADRKSLIDKAYFEGASYEEMAAQLNVPMNTMKSWLRRSLQALKSCMDRQEGNHGA